LHFCTCRSGNAGPTHQGPGLPAALPQAGARFAPSRAVKGLQTSVFEKIFFIFCIFSFIVAFLCL